MSDNKDNKKIESKTEGQPPKTRTFIVSDVREAKNFSDNPEVKGKDKK